MVRSLMLLILLVTVGCAPATARAQEGSEGAADFVREVFARYANDDADGRWPMAEENLDAVWSPGTAALIRRDRELANDDLPYLDADPLCGCQDWQDLRVIEARFYRVGGERRVAVKFSNMGEVSTVIVELYGHPGSWRLDDIITGYGESGLIVPLRESNRRLEQGGRALGRD